MAPNLNEVLASIETIHANLCTAQTTYAHWTGTDKERAAFIAGDLADARLSLEGILHDCGIYAVSLGVTPGRGNNPLTVLRPTESTGVQS